MAVESGSVPVSERRAAILDIAAEIFAQKGFASTTVREIADAAGILSGSLYHHFDSKETMVDEIIRGFIDDMVGAYTTVADSIDDPLDALQALIRTAFAAIQPHRAALTVAQNESQYLRQFERFTYLDEGYARVETIWSGVLARGIERGVFRADLDVKLMYLFMRDAIFVSVKWFRPDGHFSIEQVAATYEQFLLDGLRVVPPVRSRSTRRRAT